jgi:hypothetical protein
MDASYSRRAILFHINYFFAHLLKSKNKNLIDSYVSEFAEKYFELIHSFEPFCIDPELTENLISQSLEILTFTDERVKEKYSQSIENLRSKYKRLEEFLSGKIENSTLCNFCFPLLENSQLAQEKDNFGVLESVSVQIRKSDIQNRFNIIPSERELENKIKNQIEISWGIAFNYVKTIIRDLHLYHDVVISFENKWGIVQGNSLGTALTLTFIKELLKNYNAAVLFNAPPNNAYTGGFNAKGEIVPVSERIIKAKTTAVFFSHITTFAVPLSDLPASLNCLQELNKRYPERKLRIRGVEDFDDLISRRNLVDIRKINPLIRGGKFALKHSLSITLLLALTVIILISGLVDFDDNPATLVYDNQHLKVYNKNKKLLWSEKVGHFPSYVLDGPLVKKQYALITDVTGDGKNEVILSNKLFGQRMHDPEFNNIVCYDYAKQIVWKYTFAEVLSTNTITFSSEYRTKFIDTYELNDCRILFVIAKNYYFPSAVFGIDITTGELATEVFWHSGHLDEGLIYKDSSGAIDKLIVGGVNNGFESASLAVLEISKLAGQAPAPSNYNLNDIAPADLLEYILIPPSDYSSFKNSRYNAVIQDHLKFEDKKIRVGINETAGFGDSASVLFYYFNPDFTINFIETGDNFQHDRDRLVKEGKLSPPLTYTPEYFEILKNNIKYWDGEKLVNHSEYFKKSN